MISQRHRVHEFLREGFIDATTLASAPSMMVSHMEGQIMNGTHHSPYVEPFYRYACAESSVGRLLILMSETGVVDCIRSDSSEQLLFAAAARYPGVGFIPDRGRHANWVAAAVKRLEHPDHAACVTVDLGGRYVHDTAG